MLIIFKDKNQTNAKNGSALSKTPLEHISDQHSASMAAEKSSAQFSSEKSIPQPKTKLPPIKDKEKSVEPAKKLSTQNKASKPIQSVS